MVIKSMSRADNLFKLFEKVKDSGINLENYYVSNCLTAGIVLIRRCGKEYIEIVIEDEIDVYSNLEDNIRKQYELKDLIDLDKSMCLIELVNLGQEYDRN